MQTPTGIWEPLSDDERQAVAGLVKEYGEAGAVLRLGISRQTLARVLGGLGLRRGTEAQVRAALGVRR